jgi:hypothetical protein
MANLNDAHTFLKNKPKNVLSVPVLCDIYM